jgi:hypothetical protein
MNYLDPGKYIEWFMRNKKKPEEPKTVTAPRPMQQWGGGGAAQNAQGPALSELQARQHGLLSGNVVPLGMQGSPVLSQMAGMQQERSAFMGPQSNLPFMQGFTSASKQHSPALAGKLAGSYGGGASNAAPLPSPMDAGPQPAPEVPGAQFGINYLAPGSYTPGYFQAREQAEAQPGQQEQLAALAQAYWGS